MKSPERNSKSSYLKYSGLAVQLLLTIGIAGWIGFLLDDYLLLKFPLFMSLFGFLAFGGVMYKVYRQINKD